MFLKNDLLFSIVVPVYNSEQYLSRCITSVINQTCNNWELIIVDDGSNDNSVSICKTFQEVEHNRIKMIVSKYNEGQLSSRFKGVLAARGEYTLFLDSDDSLTIDALLFLKNEITQKNADLISFNPNLIGFSNAKQVDLFINRKFISGSNDIISEYLCKRIYGYSCFFAIKRNISLKALSELKSFFHLRYMEDLLFMHRVCLSSETCIQIPNKIYNYFYIENSSSANKDIKKYEDKFICLNYIYGENILIDKVNDKIKLLVLLNMLSYARELCFCERAFAKANLKRIRSSQLFIKYRKSVRVNDLFSKLLLSLLFFRMYTLAVFFTRKYYKNDKII